MEHQASRDDVRRVVLNTIVQLSVEHQMPMPRAITHHATGGVTIQLEDNDRDAVAQWTDALDNGPISETLVAGSGHRFFSVKSEKWAMDGPTWLNLYRVDVCSHCDSTKNGEPA
jgi:hypothetical protein